MAAPRPTYFLKEITVKRIIKYIVLPLFPLVVFMDCLIWNISHPSAKTDLGTSAKEVWATWKRW